MAINPTVTRVLARAFDVPEEDVAAVLAVNAEVARQSIEDGLAAMETTVQAPPAVLLPVDLEEYPDVY